MVLKNIHIILAFIYLSLIVLSSPIKNANSIKSSLANSNNEEEIYTVEVSDNEEVLEDSAIELSHEEEEVSTFTESEVEEEKIYVTPTIESEENLNEETIIDVNVTNEVQTISDGVRVFQIKGNYGLDELINQNGVSNELEVIEFLKKHHYLSEDANVNFGSQEYGCSSFLVPKNDSNGYYFGRNFDWGDSEIFVLLTYPDTGYASISTGNLSIVPNLTDNLNDEDKKYISAYLPLDGVNEKGLTVSVNMVGRLKVQQQTDKPDIVTSLAIRLLLDKAATVEEAINLLKNYDMHLSFNMYVHFAITDAEGNAVVVEYINNEISIINSPVNENFILTPGEYYGTRVTQDEEGNITTLERDKGRYKVIMERLEKYPRMNREQVKDTLIAANQVTTDWSVIYDKDNLEAYYYYKLNYKQGFHVKLFN